MRQLMLACLLLLALVPTLATAQHSYVGDPFPLTNTRYGVEQAYSQRLVTDGRDFYLFWLSTSANIRMTKVVPGERRAGKAVVAATSGGLDVIWTGQHFLIVINERSNLVGQLLTREGERIGGKFVLVEGASGPVLGFNGTTVALVYQNSRDAGRIWAATMNRTGVVQARERLVSRLAQQMFEMLIQPEYDIASNGDGFAVTVVGAEQDWLLTLDRNGELRSEVTLGVNGGSAPVARQGTGYLVATTDNSGGGVVMSRVDANGEILDSVPLDRAIGGSFSDLLWTGSEYIASARVERDGTLAGQIVHLDATGQQVTAVDPATVRPGWWDRALQLAGNGQRSMAAWRGRDTPGHVAELPLAAESGTEATFGAASQTLLATASGNDSSLVVWWEMHDGKPSIRAGTRGARGIWNETTAIAPQYTDRLAAVGSDGREFVVIGAETYSGEPWLQRISSSGARIGARIKLTNAPAHFVPWSMAWNGEQYVVTGRHYTQGQAYPAAAFLTPDGVVSGLRIIGDPTAFFDQRIVWNGQMYFVMTKRHVLNGNVWGYAIVGTRLGPDLQRLDANDLVLGKDVGAVAWDGTEFVVITRVNSFLAAIRVSTNGVIAGAHSIPSSFNGTDPDVAAVAGSVAVTWRNRPTSSYHLAMLRQGTTYLDREILAGRSGGVPRIVALPGSQAAVIVAEPNEVAPHHGARRLMATVTDFAPLNPVTDTPRVTVTAQPNKRLRIEWSALSQPVTGYRVEYRIGDGNWNELEHSPDPNVRTAIFGTTRPATVYSFRVRAMSDAGMGPYSDPAMAYTGKRRAVR